MRNLHWLSLCLLGWALQLSPALASGSYIGRPPQPPAFRAVDTEKYNLGKQIYLGKTQLGPVSEERAAEQAPRLKQFQERLPKNAQKTAHLPEMAGKLIPAQMQALEYYLEIRYRIK